MALPVRPPLRPMLARLARELPDAGDRRFVYEPKWDGFRCLAFRDGDEVDLRSRHDRPFSRYFPELVEAIRELGTDRFVLDGEIVLVREGRFDFEALMSRLHPAASRVQRLASEMPARFVAFDLLAEGDEDLRDTRFGERRERLERLL
ncbi:MAG: ATP-dependent DNA ligase, partial [Actinomycetota bacterium]